MKLLFLIALSILLATVLGDVYMHGPRGSNNRLNEQSATRTNANRLFDSQNNNRGGYNVGDKSDNANSNTANPDGMTGTADLSTMYDKEDHNTAMQYSLVYLEGSIVPIEWTNQHACGGNEANDPQKANCNVVLQYVCDTDSTETDGGMTVKLRDGATTTAPDAPNTNDDTGAASITQTYNNNNNAAVRGRHESEAYYWECQVRNRNKGLFLADQNIKSNNNAARYTRQNPGGTRRGLECPEERDYYPYWSPSPWRDIAYLTDDVTWCQTHVAGVNGGSINHQTIFKCTDPDTSYGDYTKNFYQYTDQENCEGALGEWRGFTHNIDPPVCKQAGWSRQNHLGNGRDAEPLTYNWTLPTVDDLAASKVQTYESGTMARCAVRIRYNISTDDYDPWTTDSDYNGKINSPIYNDPVVDIGGGLMYMDDSAKTQTEYGVQLAINTAQFGRTFQDRSHVFTVKKQTAAVQTLAAGSKIYNLNVRGKRGNIVQTYPAVEYDFQPNRIEINTGDILHVQWTGSNTHNNGNPGGDGQTGDAGEGTGGTDRNNMVPTAATDTNYPIALDKTEHESFYDHVDCYDWEGNSIDNNDCKVWLTTSGHYTSVNDAETNKDTRAFNQLLNTSPASLAQGILLKFRASAAGKKFYYICSRNNNFTNRSQKGVIIVA